MAWILTAEDGCHGQRGSVPTRSVCVLGDRDEKFRAIADALYPEYNLNQIVSDHSIAAFQADTLIVDIDLRDPCHVDHVKGVLAGGTSASQRIFVVDPGMRIAAVQAYAIGATSIFFHPVSPAALKCVLKPEAPEGDNGLSVSANAVARCSSSMGQCLRRRSMGRPSS